MVLRDYANIGEFRRVIDRERLATSGVPRRSRPFSNRDWSPSYFDRVASGSEGSAALWRIKCPGRTRLSIQLDRTLETIQNPFLSQDAYDATQHLLNCSARVRSDPDRVVRRFAELLSVDHDRVRLWLFARATTLPHGWNGDSLMDVARLIAP